MATHSSPAYLREYYANNKDRYRLYKVKNSYGLTAEAYRALWESHDGRCAICGNEPTGQKRHLSVDHDHDTGKVRGLLCNGCNSALGHLKDDPTRCEAAASYLRKHKRISH